MFQRSRLKSVGFILILVLVSLFYGCAVGMQKDLWEKPRVLDAIRMSKVIRVIVKESYEKVENPDKVGLPYFEHSKRILEYAGFDVVGSDAENYDVTLQIIAEGKPFGQFVKTQLYYGSLGYYGPIFYEHYFYIDAEIKWRLFFIKGEKELYSKSFSGKKGPFGLSVSYPVVGPRPYQKPEEAPFGEVYDIYFLPRLLEIVGQIKGIEPLIAALKDEDSGVRRAAAHALGEIKDARAVEPLITALKDKNFGGKALGALIKIGLPAVEPLIAVLKDEDSNLHHAAAYALGEIKDTRAVEPLITALKEDWWVRWGAAEALGEIKDARAIESLIATLKDEDSGVLREAEAAALKKITGQDFGTNLAKWQEWWEENKSKFKH